MHHFKHNLVINQCQWHSRLKKIVGKSHPNIFEIIDVMRKEQATTEVDLVGVDLVGVDLVGGHLQDRARWKAVYPHGWSHDKPRPSISSV